MGFRKSSEIVAIGSVSVGMTFVFRTGKISLEMAEIAPRLQELRSAASGDVQQ
jgi:hypothetical protein